VARKIVWTEPAWADLEQTAEYIAQDSPFYAAGFVREIRDAARTLATLSHRGRRVPELPGQDLRELLIGNYRLIYRVETGTVSILALIHGARDLAALWPRR
jgi:plasmid stabilization system protein ParE